MKIETIYKFIAKLAFGFCGLIILVFILAQMAEAASNIYHAFLEPNTTRLIFSREEIHNLVVILFSIFIGLELLETIKIYFTQGEIKAYLIVEIGLVAVMRKILTIDFSKSDPMFDIGMGILVVCIGITFFLVKKTGQQSVIKRMQNSAKTRFERY